jgi:hypothetical protein
MGTSTVSGPFRSQNGFQELVNGVWTPVGSGGGGSSVVIFDRPTGVDTTIELPAPSAIGDTYQYCLGPVTASSSGLVVFNTPPGLATFKGGYTQHNIANGNSTFNAYGQSSPSTSFAVDGGVDTNAFYCQIVYIGVDNSGYAIYSMSGQSYYFF